MAYTNPTFDPTVPADGDFLDLGDDSIRSAKLDVKERLETVFNSFDDDPLAFKDGIIPFKAITLDPALNFRSVILAVVNISEVIAGGAIGGGPHTVTGAEPGDVAVGSWPDGRFAVMCNVTALDTVTVALANITVGSITLTSAQLQIAVIKAGTPGALHGELTRYIVQTAFQPDNEGDPIVYSDTELTSNSDAAPLTVHAEVNLPAGNTLVRVVALVRSDHTATVVGTITRYPAVGAPVVLGTLTAAVGTGVQTLSLTVSQVIANGDMYGIQFVLDSTGSTNFNDAGLSWVQLLMT